MDAVTYPVAAKNTNALSPKRKKQVPIPFGACFFLVQLTREASTFAMQCRAISPRHQAPNSIQATNSNTTFPQRITSKSLR
jgi:hypothetical protein